MSTLDWLLVAFVIWAVASVAIGHWLAGLGRPSGTQEKPVTMVRQRRRGASNADQPSSQSQKDQL